MRWAVPLSAAAVLLLACSAAPDPRIESARDYIKEVTGDDLKAGASGLRVTIRKAVVDGRKLWISGTVANHYDRAVEGVRYTVVLSAPGDPPRVVDTIREESADTVLGPGEARGMRIEIENPIHASSTVGFDVAAEPMRLGGRDVPPPSDWK